MVPSGLASWMRTSVALRASNRELTWALAVSARMLVATNAPTPRMVPSAVSRVRRGRWVMVAAASRKVSRQCRTAGWRVIWLGLR